MRYGLRMTMDPVSYRSTRPTKRMAAGAVVLDAQGRVLLVEPTYKVSWELPGGSVEADESPRAACARELREELGLPLDVGRMLCMEWQGAEPDRTEGLMFVYDGGVLRDASTIRVPEDELRSFRFVQRSEIDGLMSERLSRRLTAALRALDEGTVAEMECGVVQDVVSR